MWRLILASTEEFHALAPRDRAASVLTSHGRWIAVVGRARNMGRPAPLEPPVGLCLRHVMFAHIAQGEVAWCERRSTTCRRDPAEPRLPHAVWASSSHDDQGVTVASGNWAGD